ncbi:hypothetical protein L2E82_36100 [Cichorium intybus]|uniref:Uncharacterized protein n=1 Tax=Cichorium intybus TaxID=13427 RepID=A0ACB9BQX0_CICIN|nr:hypothetical protein L2E82_36100 [Cichorium intybus]
MQSEKKAKCRRNNIRRLRINHQFFNTTLSSCLDLESVSSFSCIYTLSLFSLSLWSQNFLFKTSKLQMQM